jgi:hypothetical protein
MNQENEEIAKFRTGIHLFTAPEFNAWPVGKERYRSKPEIDDVSSSICVHLEVELWFFWKCSDTDVSVLGAKIQG